MSEQQKKTYFPIPGEGAWVLLSEFCQRKQEEEHHALSRDAGYAFTEQL